MAVKIFVHGSGHTSASWDKTVSYMPSGEKILRPELASLLGGREAGYENLRSAFEEYCGEIKAPLHLCGLSLGGILALDYAIAHPGKVRALVLIGTPHRVPKAAFAVQNAVFRLLPKSVFKGMAFDKRNTFALGRTMKNLDFTGKLGGVTCPALVLCGEADRSNLASAKYLAEHIRDAELKIIPGTGHVVNEESPEALSEILTEFYRVHE